MTRAVSHLPEPAALRDLLEDRLRAWGYDFGEHRPSEWDEGGTGDVHPIARAMEFAPNRVDRTLSIAYRRRRVRVVGEDGHVVGYRAADVIGGTETRIAVGRSPTSQLQPMSPMSVLIEHAALDLLRVNTTRGLVLRFQYCRRGTQTEKVAWINAEGPHALNLRTYRDHLAHARTWVESRIAS